MALTIDIQGTRQERWTLSPECLDQMERLRAREEGNAVDVLFGPATTQAGETREVSRVAALEAAGTLAKLPKVSSGFEVCGDGPIKGFGPISASGMGVVIQGKPYIIQCIDDYWIMQLIEEAAEGKIPDRKYAESEFVDEKMGIVKVKGKGLRHSDLSKLAKEMVQFLENDLTDRIRIIWG